MKNFANPEFGTGVQDDWGLTLTPAWEGVGKQGVAVAGNDSGFGCQEVELLDPETSYETS
ncbi:MAG: hypothetical protein GY850_28940 [bacterium]|nr:hypothetical protein [bacterium]